MISGMYINIGRDCLVSALGHGSANVERWTTHSLNKFWMGGQHLSFVWKKRGVDRPSASLDVPVLDEASTKQCRVRIR